MSNLMDALDTLVDNGLDGDGLDRMLGELLDADAFEDDEEKRCAVALAWSRSEGDKTLPGDVAMEHGDAVKIGGAVYRVLSEDERDAAWDESLENYLDEGGVEGASSVYFDRKAWKRNAQMDGAGPSLAVYDSNENDFCITRGDKYDYFHLYRIQ